MKLGVISDTHGLLRPEALTALSGVEQILHAGDVGDPTILSRLKEIAPVTAIRGNIDTQGLCARLPSTEFVTLNGTNIYLLHDVNALDLDPGAAGVTCIISGHSHRPGIEWKKDILFFNPGSAGPRRFSLPVTLGFLEVGHEVLRPKLLDLL